MKVMDYLQAEIRDIKKMKYLNNGEFKLTYNNEIVKRKKDEFRELNKVYKCIVDVNLELYDDEFEIENEGFCIRKESLWFCPEDKEERFIGGEVRLQDEKNSWIEITKNHLKEWFIEI